MIKSYLKIAWRTLANNKLYATLNIAGLTFGLSCFILIGLYLFDELTFDEQHSKAGRIYRVVQHTNVNGQAATIAAGGYKLAEESKKQIAEVENVTRLQRVGRANLVNPENPVYFQETVTIADAHFLQIFDFPLIAGDKNTALKEPFSIVINEDLAMRLFNSKDVLGKTLQFNYLDQPLKVTGVLKNRLPNSSFDFNSLLSEATNENDEYYKNMQQDDWLSNNFSVYTLLRPSADPALVADKMSKMVHANTAAVPGTNYSFSLQSLKDIHLNSAGIVDGARHSNVEAMPMGSVYYIKIFSLVAFFVLLIAGINYMNLTTARASGRIKEIGVRKAVGAYKGHLIRQFLFESLLVTFIAFILSIVVVNLLLPAFNQFTNKSLSLGLYTDYRIWLLAIGFAVLTGFLSGSYPALMLSRFSPALLLKGLKIRNHADLSLRKWLVVFQFTVSIIMIIGTIVLFLQVRYMNTADLGFNKDLMVVIDVNTGNARSNFEAVKTDMAKVAGVKNVSVTSRVPGEWKSFRTVKLKNSGAAGDPEVSYMLGADKDFMKTYEVQLVNGRNFDAIADSGNIIINETAARRMNIREAAGQMVEISAISWGDGSFTTLNNKLMMRLIGIVKDFHFQSLHDKIEPLMLAYNYNPIQVIDYYSVRISGANIAGTLAGLKTVMTNNDKEDPFEYHFLDEQLALFYIEDGRRQTLLIWIACATIFIACLGLFGLATYSAGQRIKEIGVRKVLGATVVGLASLLSRDFLKLVFIANLLAIPVAWWAADKWLQQYAYHIDMEWWICAVAAVSAVAIALITVSYQALKAAMANPVKSLRSE
jgi:putative ABC transport system permease protein